MPTYDYKCKNCGHAFEMFQKMSDDPLKTCPVCNGEVKRLIGTGAGTIFKGSGFYQTDYKNASSAKNDKKNATEKPEKESSSVKEKNDLPKKENVSTK